MLGGELNWDYRYVWLRDASLTLNALWVAACPDEAGRYFDWMGRAAGGYGDGHVQIMFGVEGKRDLSERELEHLAGYRGSAPVHVSNGASAAFSGSQSVAFGRVVVADDDLLALDPDDCLPGHGGVLVVRAHSEVRKPRGLPDAETSNAQLRAGQLTVKVMAATEIAPRFRHDLPLLER